MNILLAIGSAFISIYALVSIAAIIATGFSFLNRRRLFFTRKLELQLHQLIVLLIVPLSVLPFIFPSKTMFTPIVRVWAAQSLKSFGNLESNGSKQSGAFLSFVSNAPVSTAFLSFSAIGLGLLSLIFAIALLRLLRDIFLLRRLTMNSFSVRQVRRVRIVCSDRVQVPLSFRIPGQAIVCLPTELLASADNFRLSVFHELQHHRQHDTTFIYAFSALRTFCFFNPFIHLWCSVVNDVQEFACDEALVGHKNVSAQAYIGCLLEVAETVVQQRKMLDSAPSIALVAGRKKLKRRIEDMRSLKRVCLGRVSMSAIGLASAFVLLGTARATQGLIQDRRVTLKEAVALANEEPAKNDFRIIVNESVLKELNRYLGTPEGRQFIQVALERMQHYQPVVSEMSARYGVPHEFAAIPIVESGYQNLPQRRDQRGWGAGLWMFIEPTARNFGLRVDDAIDERLDIQRSTDAAMRLLLANKLRFNSWELSLLAYNVGERAVQEVIQKTGSRDVWTIINAGAVNDKNYVAKVMAAILIMKNPRVVD